MTFVVQEIVTSRPRPPVACDLPLVLGGEEIGFLCLLKGLSCEIGAMTDAQHAAFVSEMQGGEPSGSDHLFKADYVVIRSDRASEYTARRSSSALWGHYVHVDSLPVMSPGLFDENEVVRIDQAKEFPTIRHAEVMAKFASYYRPPERFLFLYHFLELDFDRDILIRLRNLESDDMRGVGQVIRDLGGGSELDRLTSLIRDMPTDGLCSAMSRVRDHIGVARTVFYDYGKNENPIKEFSDFLSYFKEVPAVTEFLFKEKKRSAPGINIDLAKNFHSSMRRSAAYWVYRVRCCIAHNRIGEYHLTSDDDIRFIESFAIPLVKEMVRFRHSVEPS